MTNRGHGVWRGANDEGMALYLVIGFLAALMIASGAFFTLLHRTMDHARAVDRHQVCIHIAEGGLDKALAELRARPGSYHGEEETALGQGLFTVEVEPPQPSGTYRVASTGFLRDGPVVLARARVAATIAVAADGAVAVLEWKEVPSW